MNTSGSVNMAVFLKKYCAQKHIIHFIRHQTNDNGFVIFFACYTFLINEKGTYTSRVLKYNFTCGRKTNFFFKFNIHPLQSNS